MSGPTLAVPHPMPPQYGPARKRMPLSPVTTPRKSHFSSNVSPLPSPVRTTHKMTGVAGAEYLRVPVWDTIDLEKGELKPPPSQRQSRHTSRTPSRANSRTSSRASSPPPNFRTTLHNTFRAAIPVLCETLDLDRLGQRLDTLPAPATQSFPTPAALLSPFSTTAKRRTLRTAPTPVHSIPALTGNTPVVDLTDDDPWFDDEARGLLIWNLIIWTLVILALLGLGNAVSETTNTFVTAAMQRDWTVHAEDAVWFGWGSGGNYNRLLGGVTDDVAGLAQSCVGDKCQWVPVF